MATIEERVHKIVIEHLGVDASKVNDIARIDDDLGADSLDAVELCMAVEEEFKIEISDAEIKTIETVGEIITLVKGRSNVEV